MVNRVARTQLVKWHDNVNLYYDFQGNGVTSLEAHFDEAPTVRFSSENCGPQLGPVDQRHPPESTNVCQCQEGVRAVSGAWWCENLENFKEDFDRNVGNGILERK